MASKDQERHAAKPASSTSLDSDEDGVKMKPFLDNDIVTANQPPKETAFYEGCTVRKRPSREAHFNSDASESDQTQARAVQKDFLGRSISLQASRRFSRVYTEKEMMPNHNSYHETISSQEAEERLRKCGSHCYLTRYSSGHQCYVLTVYKKEPNNQIEHFPISFFERRRRGMVYQIKGKNKEFRSLEDMLQYYQTNRIDPGLQNIGKCVTKEDYRAKREAERRLDERKCCKIL